MRKVVFYLVAILIMVFTPACTNSAAIIEEAVQQTVESRPPATVIAEVPVTVEVIEEIEVTTEVEVTRIVEIEVTRVVEVEITKIVEVTPIPSPTPEPSPTPTTAPQQAAAPAATAQTASVEDRFISEMEKVKREMTAYIQMIDGAFFNGFISCQEVVERHDRIKFSEQFDVSNESATVQGSYAVYRSAVDTFVNGTRDMTENCRSFLANPGAGGTIPQIQWGLARTTAEESVAIIIPAIQAVGGDVG